jgi:AcrR family transcriptional regulator
VEQIAEAAEVSPSTFFRYFPTKEDVVLYDAFDPLIFAAFEAQPAALGPIQALRGALRAVFAELSAEELAEQRERATLMVAVPELRMRMLDQVVVSTQQLAEVVARRVGRRADELAVRTFAGAVIGAMVAPLLAAITDPTADYIAVMDASLAHLEAGLPL